MKLHPSISAPNSISTQKLNTPAQQNCTTPSKVYAEQLNKKNARTSLTPSEVYKRELSKPQFTSNHNSTPKAEHFTNMRFNTETELNIFLLNHPEFNRLVTPRTLNKNQS